jgi:hypothetical protein
MKSEEGCGAKQPYLTLKHLLRQDTENYVKPPMIVYLPNGSQTPGQNQMIGEMHTSQVVQMTHCTGFTSVFVSHILISVANSRLWKHAEN